MELVIYIIIGLITLPFLVMLYIILWNLYKMTKSLNEYIQESIEDVE